MSREKINFSHFENRSNKKSPHSNFGRGEREDRNYKKKALKSSFSCTHFIKK
nr:MAG TPA: hypothetical protein [Caudoviricetes sp.]